MHFQHLPFLSYCVKALAWAALVWLLAGVLARDRFWGVALGVLLLALPIILGGLYGSTISQIRRLHIFARRGWLFRLLSGRPLRTLLWTLWALFSAFLMLVQFHAYRPLEWLILLLAPPAFWLCCRASGRLLAHELKPWLLTHMSLLWARSLCPLLLVGLYLLLLASFGEMPAYGSLAQAIEARQGGAAPQGSALLREGAGILAFFEGIKAYALGRLGETDTLWALAVVAAGALLVFYNACAILACFLIPRAEYRRLFAPLSDADHPPAVPPPRLAVQAAVITFVVLFIYLPLFSYLEAWLQQNPRVSQARQVAETRAIQRLERIDEAFFQEGTLERIQAARMEALRRTEASLNTLESRAETAFDRLEENVDPYLDWYYSLSGEYARIAHLMTGELESYMARKLEEYLQQGEAFAPVQAALDEALAQHEQALADFRAQAQAIMQRNRVEPGMGPVLTLRRIALADVLAPPAHQEMIDLRERLIAGGGGAAVAGAVTAVVVKKLLGKNIFKLAAKSLAKVLLGKTAGSTLGAGAGAAAGAAAGSVVPGLGTAIGAVIGGIAGGLAVGVSVDKMLIELEEAVNREEFRREILAAIGEARAEFMGQLEGADVP